MGSRDFKHIHVIVVIRTKKKQLNKGKDLCYRYFYTTKKKHPKNKSTREGHKTYFGTYFLICHGFCY